MLKFIGKITKLLSGIDVSEFFAELKHKEKLGFSDTFNDFFDSLLWTYLNWRPKMSSKEMPNDEKGVLVIFIDDLDRCPKERILKTLETIKLFMDKKGCVFVIGAANEIIESALEETYKKNSSRFMDKIVQATFNLPQLTTKDIESYIKKICPKIEGDITTYLELIIPVMQNNPRRLKLFLNSLSLQEGLFKNKNINVDFYHLLCWNIIGYVYPSLREDIKVNRQTFFTLKGKISEISQKLDAQADWNISEELLKTVPESLKKYIQDKSLVDILQKFDIKKDILDQLVTFSGVVESAEEVKEKAEREGQINFDAMVEVPAGKFLYGDDKQKENIEG